MTNFRADIGIICAMEIELEGIKCLMDIEGVDKISGIEFIKGTFSGKKVVASVCGVGKVFASICAEAMIITYNPELIINSGVAGGLSPSLSICDAAVGESLVQHDMDTTALGDTLGFISGINKVNLPCDERASELLVKCAKEEGINVETGVIASGDSFVSSSEKKNFIRDNFSAIACEMEGASIGHVCYVNGVKCAVLRTISDGGDDEAFVDFPAFCKKASEKSCKIMERFVREY